MCFLLSLIRFVFTFFLHCYNLYFFAWLRNISIIYRKFFQICAATSIWMTLNLSFYHNLGSFKHIQPELWISAHYIGVTVSPDAQPVEFHCALSIPKYALNTDEVLQAMPTLIRSYSSASVIPPAPLIIWLDALVGQQCSGFFKWGNPM